jgi:hypothetical protein
MEHKEQDEVFALEIINFMWKNTSWQFGVS